MHRPHIFNPIIFGTWLPRFWLLWIIFNEHRNSEVFLEYSFRALGVENKSEMLDYMKAHFQIFFEKLPYCFPKKLNEPIFPKSNEWRFLVHTPSTHGNICCFCSLWYVSVSLVCDDISLFSNFYFLDNNKCRAFSHMPIGYLYIYFEEVTVYFFLPIFWWNWFIALIFLS